MEFSRENSVNSRHNLRSTMGLDAAKAVADGSIGKVQPVCLCVCVSVCLCVRTSPCSLAPSPQAKVGELKEYLKAHKQPQAGEKEDLVARVTLHVRSRSLKIDERDPFDLKPAELRKACAQRGLNPMGERDELLKLLIDAEGGSGGGGGSSGGGAPGDDEATTLVKQV
jgi:hypothetical protein